MATAKQTAAGTWQCRGYNAYTKKQKMFTASTKTQAEKLARIYAAETRDFAKNPSDHFIFQDLCQKFIEERRHVLSPSTIREYVRITSSSLGELGEMKLSRIREEDLQKYVNDLAATAAPKTVRNRYAFIKEVLATYNPDLHPEIRLPKKKKTRIVMPNEGDIKKLLDDVAGRDIEIPILLALFGPMRRGEICALDADHVRGNTVHVEYALARDDAGRWIRKSPKTYAGDRYIVYPEFVIQKLPKTGPITGMNPEQITHAMRYVRQRTGLDYSFHQLRHWSVSYLHRMGLSDQEILDRAGWESTGIFKEVYRHGLREKDRAADVFQRFAE